MCHVSPDDAFGRVEMVFASKHGKHSSCVFSFLWLHGVLSSYPRLVPAKDPPSSDGCQQNAEAFDALWVFRCHEVGLGEMFGRIA